MNETAPTMAALLTAPAAGAIAVIRIAGPQAEQIVTRAITFPAGQRPGTLPASRTRLASIILDNEIVDEAILCRHAGDGDPIIDISTHGGPRVVQRVLAGLQRFGATLTHPGPTAADTWSGGSPLDVEVAEALARAKTPRLASVIAWQNANLRRVVPELAARVHADAAGVARELESMCRRAMALGKLLRGVSIALVGPPNAGKSSLLNRVAGRSVAITSDETGTTRDWVSQDIEIDGIPATLIDTAGAEAATDPLRERAIRVGLAAAGNADLRILVLDGSSALPPAAHPIWRETLVSPHALLAVQKSDAPPRWSPDGLPIEIRSLGPVLRVSARTGMGIETFLAEVVKALGVGDWDGQGTALFTMRQVAHARAALSDLTDRPADARRQILRVLYRPSACEISDGP